MLLRMKRKRPGDVFIYKGEPRRIPAQIINCCELGILLKKELGDQFRIELDEVTWLIWAPRRLEQVCGKYFQPPKALTNLFLA